jgi:adenosylhomocysteine nucleosidase
VIVCGIAGAVNPELGVGDVVIAEKSVQHDLGLWTDSGVESRGFENRLTGKKNPVFFAADAKLLEIAERAAKGATLRGIRIEGKEKPAKVKRGVVVTGDTFIMSQRKKTELFGRLGADAVEMEGAAIAQICYQRGIAHIVIRGISDTADEKAAVDVDTFQNIAIENAAAVVCEMAELMATQARTGQAAIGN